MTPDRWRQISAIYNAAVVRTGADRAAYVSEACVDDERLRRDVESLLAQGESFLATPVALPRGGHLGSYQLIEVIGAGGMGVVYRARDARLQRDVALKVLPEAFALDPDRVARFQREAQLLASLNHPHVAAIYGLEESAGVQALVLELVEGPTLADRIAQGPIPLEDALAIARQIAEALEAAHEQGVIHRDLKPANIKVRLDGTVKVLDFGLAKLAEPAGSGPQAGGSASLSPTTTSPAMMTGVGVLLGTAGYMSPEQAKGKPADKRSDIWAFGCVLYEMLTGKRAFEGEDVADTLATILRGEPQWAALTLASSPAVESVLRRCLEKDRRQRFRDIGDARLLLDDLPERRPLRPAPAPEPTSVRHGVGIVWGLAGIFLGLVTVPAALYFRNTSGDVESTRFSISLPGIFVSNVPGQVVSILSPDGRRLAFVASGRTDTQMGLWVRSLGEIEPHLLPGTEAAYLPFWSPDSRVLGFFSQGKLKTIDVIDGTPQSLVNVNIGQGGTWSRSGVIVFAPSPVGGLFSVPAAGGVPTPVTAREGPGDGSSHRFPAFLPDGRHFIFLTFPANEIRIGSLDTKETSLLLAADSQAQYAAPGELLFARQGTVFAQPFDARRLTAAGDPVPLVEQISRNANGYAAFSASENGTLAYRTATSGETQLTWFDRAGNPVGVEGRPGPFRNPVLSPDGTRVAMEVVDSAGANQDVWLLTLGRGVLSRFTFDSHNDIMPVWSPDGTRIAFGSDRDGGGFAIYQKLSTGAAGEELLSKSGNANGVPYSWSPDGRFILHRFMANGVFNTGVLPLSGDRTSHLFQQSPFGQTLAQVSPDGRWIAYNSNESGRFEVYVQSFPIPGGKWQISKDGGVSVKWRPDGRELFYYASDGHLMAVPVTGDTALQVGTAVPLFKARMLDGPTTAVGFRAQYDVARDGRRFLVNVPLEESAPAAITVVLNWTEMLRK